ncbi:glycosyltransferase [Candidatus Solirubrobacter pratensis]|uniref:glycosyltransferase n=1 Tax=Candidatus Solirubrobacter pratensis TaxID=1298857 RepID=UPI0004198313|nr:glycosyltransferase [Candidatus Solirubrobacter pratensis]
MRVALVHDFLLDVRGAERVFAAICDAWPDADVFTAVYDERGTEGRFAARSPRTSFLQRVRPTSRTFRPLLPLYPHAIESLDLRGYDVIVSSSSAWAHGVLVDPGAVHVCYCHNPFRYAWSEREATLAARGPLTRPALRVLLSRWRQWDSVAARRVDAYIANSAITAARVRRYFGREAQVLHPPVELGRFAPGPVGAHYLVLAELMSHKRIDVAIRAFNALGAPLVVVGDGPEWRSLRRLAGPTVRLTGRLGDEDVADLLRSARALVVTAEEEFGIAAVESLASGRPVIALRRGGVLETVREGVTGAFYDDGDDPRALAEVVARFEPALVDPAECVASARRFSVARFQERLRAIVAETVAEDRGPRDPERPIGGLLPRRVARRDAHLMRIR